MTESENLFESFCATNGLTAHRIDVNGVERRPDYDVIGRDGSAFVVEVKQFDPNAAELEAEAAFLAGKVRVTGGEPGARLRDAISDANGQIKSWAKAGVPGVLVVYRHPTASRHHTDPYSVLTAMRGLDVVPVLVPANPQDAPVFFATRPGPKGRLTPSMNRSISAVAILRDRERGDSVSLDVFHNRHAWVPLSPLAIRGTVVLHYALSSDREGWEPLHGGRPEIADDRA